MPELQSVEEIVATLRAGDLVEHRWSNLELKEAWSTSDGKKLSGLANRLHPVRNWLVIGVNDKGHLVGHAEKWAKATEQVLAQQLADKLDPVLACRRVEALQVHTSWILVLEIGNPGVVARWGGVPFKMLGTSATEMSPTEVMELTHTLPGLDDYSRRPCSSLGLDIRCLEIFSKRMPAGTSRNPAHVVEELRIADTQAARILFGECRFRVVHLDADDNVVAQNELAGVIRMLSDDVLERIQHWSSSAAGNAGGAYPETALREALANAVSHALYFDNDGEILVEIHPDRLVISNLCLPDSEAFANKWFSDIRRTTNRALVEALRTVGFVDQLGRGKMRIFRESILAGKREPIVDIEPAGRHNRWRLTLFGGPPNQRHVRLQERLLQIYGNERLALVAHALILWSDKPLASIRSLMNGSSIRVLTEVLDHPRCPIFYSKHGSGSLLKTRWVRVLLEEGLDAKALTPEEETATLRSCYRLSKTYHASRLTPKKLRDYAGFGETSSDKTISARLLKRWVQSGYLETLGRGDYRFRPQAAWDQEESSLSNILANWMSASDKTSAVPAGDVLLLNWDDIFQIK